MDKKIKKMQHKSAYIWGLIGKFGPQGVHLLTTMILARFLTPEDFGMIGVLSIIFVVANTLLDSGLGGSLVKEKEISKIDCSSIGVFNLAVSFTIYIILFFSANAIEQYFNVEGLANVVRTISLVFPISAFGIVPKAILNRNLAFRQTCYNSLVGVVAASVISIVAAYYGTGVMALVLYQIVVTGVTVICNYISSSYHFSVAFSWQSLKRLLPFGVTTTIITVIDTIYENLLTTMTGKYMNVQQAGYVYQAKKIEEVSSTSIAITIGTVTFPILTKLKDDKQAFAKEAASTFRMITNITFPVLMTIAIFAYPIITVLFGEKWYASGEYLRIFTFAGMFMIAETLYRNYIKALCEVNKLLLATIIKRIIGIALILGALVYNPDTMIYAYVLSAAIGFLINIILYSKVITISFSNILLNFIKVIIPSLIYYLIYVLLGITQLAFVYQIVYSFFVLVVIYFIILPQEGIHILSIIKRK